MAARSIASGTVAFGLVSVPVKIYTAVSAKSVSFNLLHKSCGGRVKEQLIGDARGRAKTQHICSVENVVVERSDMVKGFEIQRDQYVKFTDEEMKGMEAARTDTLDLLEFVPAETFDQLYIDRTYFLGPDKGGDRSYALLAEALTRAKRIAIGRFARRGRDQLVALRPFSKSTRYPSKCGLIMYECHYAEEVRSFDDVETGGAFEFKDIELELADKLIAQLDQPRFEPERFKDTWAEKVNEAVLRKVAGEEFIAPAEAPKAQIIDLLESLKRSVAEARGEPMNEHKAPRGSVPSPKGGPKKARLRAVPKKTDTAEGAE